MRFIKTPKWSHKEEAMNTMLTVRRPLPLWFIDALARIHVDGAETDGRVSVVEASARLGDMPPLHVHHREDEIFHVLEGRMTLHLPGEQVELEAGSTLLAPKGVPHTYRVESETARWLVVCQPAGFERFVAAISQTAPSDELPPLDREHDLGAINAAAEAHGIELLGPPGALPEAP
jgi:mannose-6-phosphate isomerase-like protein (cupin superfamily)